MNDFIVRSYTQRLVAVVVCAIFLWVNIHAAEALVVGWFVSWVSPSPSTPNSKCVVPTDYHHYSKVNPDSTGKFPNVFDRDDYAFLDFLAKTCPVYYKNQIFAACQELSRQNSYPDKIKESISRLFPNKEGEKVCIHTEFVQAKEAWLKTSQNAELLNPDELLDCIHEQIKAEVVTQLRSLIEKNLKEALVDRIRTQSTCPKDVDAKSVLLDVNKKNILEIISQIDLQLLSFLFNGIKQGPFQVTDFLGHIEFGTVNEVDTSDIKQFRRNHISLDLVPRIAQICVNNMLSEFDDLAQKLPKDFAPSIVRTKFIKKSIAAAMFAFIAACVAVYADSEFLMWPAMVASLASGIFGAYSGSKGFGYGITAGDYNCSKDEIMSVLKAASDQVKAEKQSTNLPPEQQQ